MACLATGCFESQMFQTIMTQINGRTNSTRGSWAADTVSGWGSSELGGYTWEILLCTCATFSRHPSCSGGKQQIRGIFDLTLNVQCCWGFSLVYSKEASVLPQLSALWKSGCWRCTESQANKSHSQCPLPLSCPLSSSQRRQLISPLGFLIQWINQAWWDFC